MPGVTSLVSGRARIQTRVTPLQGPARPEPTLLLRSHHIQAGREHREPPGMWVPKREVPGQVHQQVYLSPFLFMDLSPPAYQPLELRRQGSPCPCLPAGDTLAWESSHVWLWCACWVP